MKANLLSPLTGTLALALAAVLPLQADVLINTATTVGLGDPALDGQRVVVSGTTLTLAGSHTFSALVLSNHAALTHVDAPSGQADHAIRLTITGNVEIDGASRIDATGRGYAEANSPGFGKAVSAGNNPSLALLQAAPATCGEITGRSDSSDASLGPSSPGPLPRRQLPIPRHSPPGKIRAPAS